MKVHTAAVRLFLVASLVCPAITIQAQTPAPATATAPQIGTIQTLDAGTLGLTTDKGDKVTVTLAPETKIVQLAPGSTDLKTAQPAAASDLAVGDRVLVVAAAGGTPTALTARRLVLMKSTDIAKRRATEQAAWQRGSGGVVSNIAADTGTITLSSGGRSITVDTTSSTIFRRYAPASVRFEDATKSSFAELQVGDQLRVRGDKSADGAIHADEIVSGSFRHLSGTIQSIDAAGNQLTVRDLKTSKPVVLSITPGTAIHQLPAEVAARFAARSKAAAEGGKAAAGATPAAAPAATANPSETTAGSHAGADLSQIVSRLPAESLASLKVGDAVMVVGGDGTAGSIAAITVLSGVDAILAASPNGGAEMALSPWSMSSGEAGGAAQ